MFTGIIESTGLIEEIIQDGTNVRYRISSKISKELKVDQSVSHDGVCLTVTDLADDSHWVTAIRESLSKSNLNLRQVGDRMNLERCMIANGRFDGHIVQGHVDQVATCRSIRDENGSWLFEFQYDPAFGNVTVEKGSICVNGVSLTCFDSRDGEFTVAIIPYTYEHTNFHSMAVGDKVNLEFDIIGKYVKRLLGT